MTPAGTGRDRPDGETEREEGEQRMSQMTAAERLELGKLVRLNAKVAKDDAEARGKWLVADVEAKLAAIYKSEDAAWADITAAAEKAVQEADAAIAAVCRERGIPEDFRPSLRLEWYGRGVNALKGRRAELRRVAETQIAAMVKRAQVEIDRQAASQLTQITAAGLTSEAARAFIGSMPTPEQLLPPLDALHLPNGERLALPTDLPSVTKADESVTKAGKPETDNCYKCVYCGKAFRPGRSDRKYCRPACRVADYRQRLAEGDFG
jgi:hypothetical protein